MDTKEEKIEYQIQKRMQFEDMEIYIGMKNRVASIYYTEELKRNDQKEEKL